jgi:hypothetical protein
MRRSRNLNDVEQNSRPDTARGKGLGMELKSALEYIFSRLKDKQPVTHTVGKVEYAVKSDGTLGNPVLELAPQWDKPTFTVGTLSALRELWDGKVDGFGDEVGLHVADYLTVHLISLQADEFGRRHIYATATHRSETPFKFGVYLEAEQFLIDMRTSFLFDDEAVKLHSFCSQLESGMTVSLADDGVSQKLEVKAGTSSKSAVTIPAEGISLIPWRTFRDASPVSSKFLLRVKTVKDSLPHIALFEIDQKWKLDTINSIAEWLRKHAKGAKIVA